MNVFTRFGRSTLKTRFLCLYPKVQTVSLALLIPLMCLFAVQQGSAQADPAHTATPNAQPLTIGDPIPDEVWSMPLSVVNHPDGKETITLADYKDKLIIIDFWATWCVPCIKSLYKLDTLQGQFADDLVVIPTTYEEATKAGDFFDQKGWSLPTAVLETTLKNYFPHQSIPHQVWVKDGNLLAIAGAEYANADYIGKVLQGQEVDFNHKIEVAFDKNKPLFLDGNGGNGSNMLYQSVISRRISARVSGVNRPSSNEIMAYNRTIEQLYSTAFQGQGLPYLTYFTTQRYILYEVDDSLKYRISPHMMLSLGIDSIISQWANDNTYCYNLVLPKESSEIEIRKRMLQDLNEFFAIYLNLIVSYESREVKSLAIVKSESYNDLTTKGGDSIENLDLENSLFSIKNKPINSLIEYMGAVLYNRSNHNLEPYPYPIVDETGIVENVDLDVKANFLEIDSVREALNIHGLDLVEKISPVKMIVFSYNQQPNQ